MRREGRTQLSSICCQNRRLHKIQVIPPFFETERRLSEAKAEGELKEFESIFPILLADIQRVILQEYNCNRFEGDALLSYATAC